MDPAAGSKSAGSTKKGKDPNKKDLASVGLEPTSAKSIPGNPPTSPDKNARTSYEKRRSSGTAEPIFAGPPSPDKKPAQDEHAASSSQRSPGKRPSFTPEKVAFPASVGDPSPSEKGKTYGLGEDELTSESESERSRLSSAYDDDLSPGNSGVFTGIGFDSGAVPLPGPIDDASYRKNTQGSSTPSSVRLSEGARQRNPRFDPPVRKSSDSNARERGSAPSRPSKQRSSGSSTGSSLTLGPQRLVIIEEENPTRLMLDPAKLEKYEKEHRPQDLDPALARSPSHTPTMPPIAENLELMEDKSLDGRRTESAYSMRSSKPGFRTSEASSGSSSDFPGLPPPLSISTSDGGIFIQPDYPKVLLPKVPESPASSHIDSDLERELQNRFLDPMPEDLDRGEIEESLRSSRAQTPVMGPIKEGVSLNDDPTSPELRKKFSEPMPLDLDPEAFSLPARKPSEESVLSRSSSTTPRLRSIKGGASPPPEMDPAMREKYTGKMPVDLSAADVEESMDALRGSASSSSFAMEPIKEHATLDKDPNLRTVDPEMRTKYTDKMPKDLDPKAIDDMVHHRGPAAAVASPSMRPIKEGVTLNNDTTDPELRKKYSESIPHDLDPRAVEQQRKAYAASPMMSPASMMPSIKEGVSLSEDTTDPALKKKYNDKMPPDLDPTMFELSVSHALGLPGDSSPVDSKGSSASRPERGSRRSASSSPSMQPIEEESCEHEDCDDGVGIGAWEGSHSLSSSSDPDAGVVGAKKAQKGPGGPTKSVVKGPIGAAPDDELPGSAALTRGLRQRRSKSGAAGPERSSQGSEEQAWDRVSQQELDAALNRALEESNGVLGPAKKRDSGFSSGEESVDLRKVGQQPGFLAVAKAGSGVALARGSGVRRGSGSSSRNTFLRRTCPFLFTWSDAALRWVLHYPLLFWQDVILKQRKYLDDYEYFQQMGSVSSSARLQALSRAVKDDDDHLEGDMPPFSLSRATSSADSVPNGGDALGDTLPGGVLLGEVLGNRGKSMPPKTQNPKYLYRQQSSLFRNVCHLLIGGVFVAFLFFKLE